MVHPFLVYLKDTKFEMIDVGQIYEDAAKTDFVTLPKFWDAIFPVNNIEYARQLLIEGEDPNGTWWDLMPTIHVVIREVTNDLDDWIELFYEHKVRLVDDNGYTLLHLIAGRRDFHERSLVNCLKWGIDINAKNIFGDTAMMLAQSKETIDWLVKHS